MGQTESIVGLGARTDLLAMAPGAEGRSSTLTAEERRLLSCVGRGSSLGDILARSGIAEARAIATLLSLRAKGMIVPARVQPRAPKAAVDAAMSEDIELLSERRREILELEQRLPTVSPFELLGVTPEVDAEALRRAYHEASKRFHPDRFFGKNLGSFRRRIEAIFRKVTEAYQLLSDPDQRRAYLDAHPELRPPPPPAPEPRAEDAQRVAERQGRLSRHPYLQGTRRAGELLAEARVALGKGEAAEALRLAKAAAGLDPNNTELARLLEQARGAQQAARLRKELERAVAAERGGNPQQALLIYREVFLADPSSAKAAAGASRMLRLRGELPEALRLAQRAAELAPRDPALNLSCAELLAETGQKKLARRGFERVLELVPDHPEAKAHLRRLRWTL